MSPPTPTATESPGRFCSVRPARTICRPCSTASAHFGDGAECVTDGTSCGFGCRGVAVALMYTQSPRIAASSRPTATTISASQVCVRLFIISLRGASPLGLPYTRPRSPLPPARSGRVARSRRSLAPASIHSLHRLFSPRGFAPRTPLHAPSLAAPPARSGRVARSLRSLATSNRCTNHRLSPRGFALPTPLTR